MKNIRFCSADYPIKSSFFSLILSSNAIHEFTQNRHICWAASEAKLWWTPQNTINQKFQDSVHALGRRTSILISSLAAVWCLYYAFAHLWPSSETLLTYGSNYISDHMGRSELWLEYCKPASPFCLPSFIAKVPYSILHFLHFFHQVSVLPHFQLLYL